MFAKVRARILLAPKPEYKIRIVNDFVKLEANYDLLLICDRNVQIWDWKTGGVRNKDKFKFNTDNLQTLVYLYVLGESIFKQKELMSMNLKLDNIEMFYWSPNPPKTIGSIKYSEKMHNNFGVKIKEIISSILNYDYESFDKSCCIEHCNYCEFNWFCNGNKVDLASIEDEIDEFGWDDVEEMI